MAYENKVRYLRSCCLSAVCLRCNRGSGLKCFFCCPSTSSLSDWGGGFFFQNMLDDAVQFLGDVGSMSSCKEGIVLLIFRRHGTQKKGVPKNQLTIPRDEGVLFCSSVALTKTLPHRYLTRHALHLHRACMHWRKGQNREREKIEERRDGKGLDRKVQIPYIPITGVALFPLVILVSPNYPLFFSLTSSPRQVQVISGHGNRWVETGKRERERNERKKKRTAPGTPPHCRKKNEKKKGACTC